MINDEGKTDLDGDSQPTGDVASRARAWKQIADSFEKKREKSFAQSNPPDSDVSSAVFISLCQADDWALKLLLHDYGLPEHLNLQLIDLNFNEDDEVDLCGPRAALFEQLATYIANPSCPVTRIYLDLPTERIAAMRCVEVIFRDNSSIKDVEISGRRWGVYPDNLPELLGANTKLERLRVANLFDEGEAVCNFLEINRGVRELEVLCDKTWKLESSTRFLQAASRHPTLEKLCLQSCKINTEQIELFAKIYKIIRCSLIWLYSLRHSIKRAATPSGISLPITNPFRNWKFAT